MNFLLIHLKLIAFILIFASSSSNSIELNCNFMSGSWWYSGQVYLCDVTNNKSGFDDDRIKVTSAIGNHKEGKNNNQVTGVQFRFFRRIHLFPKNLENVFPNLEFIYIYVSRLSEIKQSDLEPFTKLKYLYLDVNNIKVLEPELFKYNPNLEVVWFSNNPIEHVDPNIFSQLTHLRALLMGSCTNGVNFPSAYSKDDTLVQVKRFENGECTSSYYNHVSTRITSECQQKNNEAEVKINELNVEIGNLQTEIAQLKNVNNDLCLRNTKITEEYQDLLKTFNSFFG